MRRGLRAWLHDLFPEGVIAIVATFAIVSYLTEWVARWLLREGKTHEYT